MQFDEAILDFISGRIREKNRELGTEIEIGEEGIFGLFHFTELLCLHFLELSNRVRKMEKEKKLSARHLRQCVESFELLRKSKASERARKTPRIILKKTMQNSEDIEKREQEELLALRRKLREQRRERERRRVRKRVEKERRRNRRRIERKMRETRKILDAIATSNPREQQNEIK